MMRENILYTMSKFINNHIINGNPVNYYKSVTVIMTLREATQPNIPANQNRTVFHFWAALHNVTQTSTNYAKLIV